MLSTLRIVAAASLAFAVSVPLTAQCGFQWLPGAAAAGVDGNVLAVVPLPNGDVIAGGSFGIADATVANNIARWDGTTWRALGAGIDGIVRAVVRMPNGDLVAGGTFTSVGGQPANYVARWNGSSWAPLGTGLDSHVFALLALPNGELIAGGAFVFAGATMVDRIARWNGTTWSPIGAGLNGFQINALARLANGDLVAGGDLSAQYGLARWDGVSWQTIPGIDPFTYPSIESLSVAPNGDLWIVGYMSIGTYTRIARWDGTTMQAFNSPIVPQRVVARGNGEVWVGGNATSAVASLARWDGTNWTTVAGGPARVRALAEDASSRLLVGAEPDTMPRERAVTRFDGVAWQSLGGPKPPLVTAMVRMNNGDVVVGGTFTTFRGIAANNVARWNGSAWSPLGLGVDGPVTALATSATGDLIACGNFANAGGAPANRVARWHGGAWSTLGGGLTLPATLLAAAVTGEVLAFAPGMPARRFDGLTWVPAVLPGSGQTIMSLAALPNGDFLAGGVFFGAPLATTTGLIRYSSGVVSAIPGAAIAVPRMFVTDSGDVIARSNGISRWNGSTWTALPPTGGATFGELADGDLLAGGYHGPAGGGAPSSVVRLANGAWVSIGEVVGGTAPIVAGSGHGDVFVGGTVQTAAGLISVGFAHGIPTCVAVATVFGSGCTGGAGPVTLAAQNKPWVGGTFRSVAAGMTANSLALQVVGLPAASQALPGGAPGCSLFVNPLLLDVLVPAAGTAAGAFVIPNQLSLTGQLLRVQTIGIELSATSIVRLTGTNALDLTIGAL